MAGSVPEDFIETVRSRIDLVELIGEYVQLRKTGRNYVGLCPFHTEKTPSFTVSPEKQIFYCFGCGTGGNAFTFLMKRDHLTFPEAVEFLAQRLGLEVPHTGGGRQKRGRLEQLYAVYLQAAKFYHSILMKAPEGETGRSYLSRRGLRRETWEHFSLGFAPPHGYQLLEFLAEQGFDRHFLAGSGLFTGHQDRLYDRMAGRVVFPIFDRQGRCTGFGGRSLGEEQPKYLNSAESPVFSKSRTLYGLNFAAEAIREQGEVLVVEGYMDCITAHQHGFTNTVAALGTAFTHEQARLLLRYTKRVLLAFDHDAAGSAASLRGAGYLQELGAEVRVLDLPAGKDPDEFLREQGKEAFAGVLANRAVPFLDFKIGELRRQHDPATAVGKAAMVDSILEDLARTENLVLREEYLKRAAELLEVSPEAIRSELLRYLGKRQGTKDRNEKNRYNMERGKQIFVNQSATAGEAARRGLFRFMCLDRQIWELVKEELGLAVFGEKLRHYLELVADTGWRSPAELLDQVAEEDQAELANLLLAGDEQEIDRQQQQRMIRDYLCAIKKEQIWQKIERNQAALRECEKNQDQAGIKDLLAELYRLYQELQKPAFLSQERGEQM